MIQIDRNNIREPGFFTSPEFGKFKQELIEFHLGGGTRTQQTWFPWREQLEQYMPQAMEALTQVFHAKCAYTEVLLSEDMSGEMILHRPPADAIGIDGTPSPDHYWWMIPQWSNWYLASRRVSSVKKTQFPVIGQRVEPPPDGQYSAFEEKPLLIDPCSADPRDDPAWHLMFWRSGKVGVWDVHRGQMYPDRFPARSELRGVNTIRVLDLNNKSLVKQRSRAASQAGSQFRRILRGEADPQLFKNMMSDDVEFAATVRASCARYILDVLGKRQGKLLSTDTRSPLLLEFAQGLKTQLAVSVVCEGDRWEFSGRAGRVLESSRSHLMEVFPGAGLEGLFDANLKPGGSRREARRSVRADQREPIKLQVSAPVELQRPVISRTAHVSTIRIKNFRAIHDLSLSVDDLATHETAVTLMPEYGAVDQRTIPSARRWWSLLGENGSGKSSILQAIGLGLAGGKIDSIMKDADLAWSKLLRRVPTGSGEIVRQGRVCLDFSDGTRVDLRFNANKHWWVPDMRGTHDRHTGEPVPRSGLPVVEAYIRGYGATRLLEQGAISPNLDNVRVANLFDPRVAVINARDWLLSLDTDDFNVAAPTISSLLHHQGLAVDERDTSPLAGTPKKLVLTKNFDNTDVEIAEVPIELASDGYRAVVAFASDIMAGLGKGLSSMEHAPGIVLIDEIGAHLHPRWRMSITSKLRRALPQVQFIVSTHEPLCLRGLFEREVVRVEKHPNYGVLVTVIDRNPSHYRVDQLLTSEFFGLDTTIEPDLERRFQHYYRLLALATRSEEQEKELADLFQYLQQHARPSLGHTRRDQMVYEEIDKYLSSEYQPVDKQLSREEFVEARKERRRKALRSVQDIWERRRAVKVTRSSE